MKILILVVFLLISIGVYAQQVPKQREIFFKIEEQHQKLRDDFTLKIETRLGTFIIPLSPN